LIDNSNNRREEIFDTYGIFDVNGGIYSNSEILQMITLKDYKDWLKGYETVVKDCEVQFEQANIMIPVIKKK
jgi:hypothetical protein